MSSSHTGTGCRVLVSVLLIMCLSFPIAGTDRLIQKASAQKSEAVFFDPNDHGVRPGEESDLNRYLTLLKNDPGLVIVIDGYSDITGEEQYNLNLSRMRADAVKKFYVSHGIAADRIKARGNGKTDKFDSGIDDESLKMNRRVVITLEADPTKKDAPLEKPAPTTAAVETPVEKPAAAPLPGSPGEVIEEGAVIEDAPQLSEEATRLIRQVANLQKQQRMILLLDVDQLLETGEAKALAALH